MARNGSGTYSLPATRATANTVSSSVTVNAIDDDIATALTDSINVDGTKAFEANQSVGGFKFTSLGSGSARTDSINMGQVQDGKANWVAAGGTADVITATYSPAITALVDGQECTFRASAANTSTTPTFAPNGLTARTIVKNGGSALAVGDIAAAGHEVILKYLLASTRWELLNPAIQAGLSAASTTEVLTGTDTAKYPTPNAIAALWEAGADITDGAAITIGEGGYFNLITSTTAITSFSITTDKAGRTFRVRFDTARTLTHNATSLILPGGANITTAQGDIAQVRSLGSGNVVVEWYSKASGVATVVATTGITLVAEQASTSGTAITFGSIPAGVKRITVMFDGVSFDNPSIEMALQIGDAGGIETTGYASGRIRVDSTPTTTYQAVATRFNLLLTGSGGGGTSLIYGAATLNRQDSSHTWIATWTLYATNTGGDSPAVQTGTGRKALSAELTQLEINGGTFDAGSISISYE